MRFVPSGSKDYHGVLSRDKRELHVPLASGLLR